jgi:hypothetical protein
MEFATSEVGARKQPGAGLLESIAAFVVERAQEAGEFEVTAHILAFRPLRQPPQNRRQIRLELEDPLPRILPLLR